ncbi:hypothetical protein AaE_005593 [Aphanomyces astaci]|uniref:Uncharacterized protein n=1 Tax=Aphanomyces astaci TaxID=112090 RepID=A0A6A5AFS1_APHAT|nr:hypothetical protein AaE_005593 [Aphanomyces astaci]
MAPTALALPRTVREILDTMNALRLDDVASYFDKEGHDIDPYVVCEGVSVHALNAYVGDGEGLRVALRFLDLSSDGVFRLSSSQQEYSLAIRTKFLRATGNEDEVSTRGSMMASSAALPNKEADATFG